MSPNVGRGESRGGTIAASLLLSYVAGGTLLAIPFMGDDAYPALAAYAAGAAVVSLLLWIAVLTRSARLAVGAAIFVPLLVSMAWHAYQYSREQDVRNLAAAGDPAAIARVLHRAEQGWLGSVRVPVVTGSLAALLGAFFWMWWLDRAARPGQNGGHWDDVDEQDHRDQDPWSGSRPR